MLEAWQQKCAVQTKMNNTEAWSVGEVADVALIHSYGDDELKRLNFEVNTEFLFKTNKFQLPCVRYQV